MDPEWGGRLEHTADVGRGLAERESSRAGIQEGQDGCGQSAYPLFGVAGMCELPVGQEGLGTFRRTSCEGQGLSTKIRGSL